jgi:hypothetical protein
VSRLLPGLGLLFRWLLPVAGAWGSAPEGEGACPTRRASEVATRTFSPVWRRVRLGANQKELPGCGTLLATFQSIGLNKPFVSLSYLSLNFGMKNALTPYERKGAKTLNSDLVVPMCPVCGGDRTSVAHTNRGELYCVDCNRIHLVLEPH